LRDPIDDEVSVKAIEGISQALKGYFPDDHETIKTHGCQCNRFKSRVDDYGAEFDIGEPVDDLDSVCHKWYQARKCILKRGGHCFDQEEKFYAVAGGFSTYFGTYFDDECTANFDKECETEACYIDAYFALEIKNLLDSGATVAQAELGSCIVTPGEPKDRCCGTWPDIKSYNNRTHRCLRGEVRERQRRKRYRDNGEEYYYYEYDENYENEQIDY